MAKYHVNMNTGNVSQCIATVGTCPYGGQTGEDNHYGSVSEAYKGYEDKMNSHLTKGQRGFDESVFSGLKIGTHTVNGVTATIGGFGNIVRISNCAQCEKSEYGPSHTASERCKSGKRNHCTCDTCY